MNKEIRQLDEKGNCIYLKTSKGEEVRYEYDERNRRIYFNNITHGWKHWFKHNENNEKIVITQQEFEQIKEKEFLSREEISIFELMEL